jgi:hypothetical protein
MALGAAESAPRDEGCDYGQNGQHADHAGRHAQGRRRV